MPRQSAATPVLYRRRGAVGVVTLSRPQALNAIDSGMRRRLESVIHRADDDPRVRAIVVTGAGDRAFSAGADINEFEAPRSVATARVTRQGIQFTDTVAAANKPTIAAIHGYCLGGGLELALACDIRLASDDAVFGLPEVTIGLIPGAGGTQRLSRVLGVGPALWLCLTGDRIDAATALRVGLVSTVVARSELMGAALSLAERLAANAPLAMAYAKEAVLTGSGMPLTDGLRLERDLATVLSTTSDRAEGLAAFREKRKPLYRGD